MLPVAILAGGLATRLGPLTESVPKALIDVNGEPFVLHQLRLLRAHGIEKIVLCVSYLGDQIVSAVGDGSQFGLQVIFSFDGPHLLGTAGAVKLALPQLGESFFALYGDSYLECDYRAVQTAFESCGKNGLMTVFRNAGHWDSSNVEYVNGRILAYSKRERTPRMHYIDYGLGVFRESAFANIPDNSQYDLESLYQDLLRKNQLAAVEVTQRFYEIGSLSGLTDLRHHLRDRRQDQNANEFYPTAS